jgi:hypothetical protein
MTEHPYRSTHPPARPDRASGEDRSLTLALGVLVVVSLIQLVAAYCDAGPCAAQTLAGGGFLAAGAFGLVELRRRPRARLSHARPRALHQLRFPHQQVERRISWS